MNEELKTLIKSRKFLWSVGAALFLVLICSITYYILFAAPDKNAETVGYVITPGLMIQGQTPTYNINIENLKSNGYIKSSLGFKIAFVLRGGKETPPGDYQISKSMNAWELAGVFAKGPSLALVVIPEGLRKEQIAEILSQKLNWPPGIKNTWLRELTALKFDEVEGVYFPDTYLIPLNDTPLEIANRLRSNFNEKFALYSTEALKQNIQWTTVVKIASLVQREAAGNSDMPLIAGIIWNRLDQGMKLEIDSTVQYVRDTKNSYDNDLCEDPNSSIKQKDLCYKDAIKQPYPVYVGISDWWKPITPADKQLDSLYNTYLYKGLPPHPISNPGIDAIKAVLYPEKTDCLYYLHDSSKNIHCAKTYQEHQQNINTFLK